MSDPEPADTAPRSWQQLSFLRAAVPGWGLSLAVHTLFLFMLSSSLQSCGGSGGGEITGDFRQVGIVMASEPPSPATETTANESTTIEPKVNPTEVPEIPAEPPTEISVPSLNPEITGPGSISPPAALIDPSHTILDAAPNSIPAPSALPQGNGKVDFLGTSDEGESFVYLIDCSGSMGDPIDAISRSDKKKKTLTALDFAKAELLASLQGLTVKQRFQVIFYNENVYPFSIPGVKGSLYSATDFNKNKAKRFILGIRAELGTRHLPALERGLSLKPDVIFFLTDANSALSAADLAHLKRANSNRTRINCVEFGTGNRINLEDFATRLAAQSSGHYKYHDVTKLVPMRASATE